MIFYFRIMTYQRNVYPYKRYFLDFYETQTPDIQLKIEWTIQLIRTLMVVPKNYFKYLTGSQGLYEIRVQYRGYAIRILSFFNKDNAIILCQAFFKKTRKTPRNEIKKALQIKFEYETEKPNLTD